MGNDHLNTLHTRELLDYLERARGGNSPYSVERIKDVLATREHIPNRQERKEQRQAEGKLKRTRRYR